MELYWELSIRISIKVIHFYSLVPKPEKSGFLTTRTVVKKSDFKLKGMKIVESKKSSSKSKKKVKKWEFKKNHISSKQPKLNIKLEKILNCYSSHVRGTSAGSESNKGTSRNGSKPRHKPKIQSSWGINSPVKKHIKITKNKKMKKWNTTHKSTHALATQFALQMAVK